MGGERPAERVREVRRRAVPHPLSRMERRIERQACMPLCEQIRSLLTQPEAVEGVGRRHAHAPGVSGAAAAASSGLGGTRAGDEHTSCTVLVLQGRPACATTRPEACTVHPAHRSVAYQLRRMLLFMLVCVNANMVLPARQGGSGR